MLLNLLLKNTDLEAEFNQDIENLLDNYKS